MSNPFTVDDRCVEAFRELQADRYTNAVFYRLSESAGSCIVERLANLRHEDLLRGLPPDEPRIVAYDLAFATVDGVRQSKVLLILWLPSGTMPQSATLYRRAHAALGVLLEGSHLPLHVREIGELGYYDLVAFARRRRR
ncbi:MULTISPECIES: hypothetical protein [unclassified Streptomyces]|uniref:hypothetical protein n=1 Tax=unclassified Streptomyces TaxID=2593676 RepID=UPI00224F19F3|nr:hypothetical protein [Streptomyces sp. NBC_00687]MCX4918441.1 hypothetical protein [Streptomyces sp. NBC_00687]